MYGYVYEVTNRINGMKYIGYHKYDKPQIDESYFGSGVRFRRALEHYVEENFDRKILQCYETQHEMEAGEKYWIQYFDAANDPGYYNISEGGHGGSHGPNFHQEVTPKMLLALEKGRHLPASEKQKKQLADRRRNCIVSEETRAKLRIAGAKGVLAYTDESRRLKSEFMKLHNPGRNKTPETIEKLRESSIGRVHIHKGTINKNPKREDLQSYLDDGYELGYYYQV